MSTHTPGPWTWKRLDPDPKYTSADMLVDSKGDYVVVGIWCNDSTADVGLRSSADAALIAAAPDLLAALKHVAEFYHEAGTAERFAADFDIDAVLAAIAKAEGTEPVRAQKDRP